VVAAMVAAESKEIPMTKVKSKRKPASRTNDSKTKTRNGVRRTTAREAVQLKSDAKPAAHQQPQSASQPTARHLSKKAHIIAMLRAPGGATIEAMARAAKWQPHSVRGFLAGVVRKKLGLTLVSADGESGRVYRISDRNASAAA
jgi:transglutaminase/protease-like cytokinesis protein 3